MPTSQTKDSFDHLPHNVDRVGAHRAPEKKGRRWIAVGWIFGATAVLVVAGIVGLAVLDQRLNISLPGVTTTETAAEAESTPAATIDPSLSVTVLNGTPQSGTAAAVGETLTAAGWQVGATANASTTDVTETIVYYADPALEGAARGVSEALAASEVLLAQDFADSGADLTVIVGSDYLAVAPAAG